jgi:BlaI family penicillinase repressor
MQKLGTVQLEIMKVLWSRGQATARDVTDALEPTHHLAHSTVQTLLRKLETKGAVTHDDSSRIFLFRPVWREADTTADATSDLLTRVFGGSITGLVSHLLKHETIDAEEMAKLREMIDQAGEHKTNG